MKQEKETKIYERVCPNPTNNPNCSNTMKYENVKKFNRAERNNSMCRSCASSRQHSKIANTFTRVCPNMGNYANCAKILVYQTKYGCHNANTQKTLCRNCQRHIRHMNNNLHDLSILLEDTHDAFYWIGYLLADGSFNSKHLSFDTAHDLNQLLKFAKFIKYKNKIYINNKQETHYKLNTIRVMDSINIEKIMLKFDINNRKTYNPPDFDKYDLFDRKLIFSLFVGFVDGDGCLHKCKNKYSSIVLTINIHKTWENFLKKINEYIFDNKFVIKVNRELVRMTTWNRSLIKQIKSHINEYKLPVLERKWDKIDLNDYSKKEYMQMIIPKLYAEFEISKTTKKEIANKYNLSLQTVCNHYKKFINETKK